jgi:hypothetical protein
MMHSCTRALASRASFSLVPRWLGGWVRDRWVVGSAERASVLSCFSEGVFLAASRNFVQRFR